MVKSPRTRHSKASRDPVTIDLEAEAVERKQEEARPEDEQITEKGPDAVETEPPQVDIATAATDGEEVTAPEPTGSNDDEPDLADPAQTSPDSERPDETVKAGEGRRSTGAVALGLIAGLIGGAAAGAGLWYAGQYIDNDAASPDPAVEELRQDVRSLAGELREVQERVAMPTDEGANAAITDLRPRIAEIESQVRALQENVNALESLPQTAPGDAALVPIEQRLSLLERRLTALGETAGNSDSEELGRQLATAQSNIEQLMQEAVGARQSATQNAQNLEELGSRLEMLEERLESIDEGPRLAVVVAASALRSAVERGEPFSGELETYLALGTEEAAVEPLFPYAKTGIPTDAQLAAQAPAIATQIVAATKSDLPPDAGFVERLIASARSAITVRPVGVVEGDTPEAIAARLEEAVQQGDYAMAIAEYEKLPDRAKAVAGDFAEQLRARMTANEVLENALSNALNPA